MLVYVLVVPGAFISSPGLKTPATRVPFHGCPAAGDKKPGFEAL
jgi:hypothetical protein